jgi:hypothetical protein
VEDGLVSKESFNYPEELQAEEQQASNPPKDWIWTVTGFHLFILLVFGIALAMVVDLVL